MLIAEDMVLLLRCSVNLMRAVGLMPHELGGDLFRKENLAVVRGMSRLVGLACGMAANANLEVDVVVRPM